jgi:hypothetical protein
MQASESAANLEAAARSRAAGGTSGREAASDARAVGVAPAGADGDEDVARGWGGSERHDERATISRGQACRR